MDELTEDIDRAIDLLNVLKSRYFFLRAKYDIKLNSQVICASKDIQTEYLCASHDLQSFNMLELHLLEYACTYGVYSMNMYATRLRTDLTENNTDPYYLKLLKNAVQSLVNTNDEIKNLTVDTYNNFQSYIKSFVVYDNVLNEINIPYNITFDNTDINKRKKKLMKKIKKINLMANIITRFVSVKDMDYRTEIGRATLNIALKYRTPRCLEYYTNEDELKK